MAFNYRDGAEIEEFQNKLKNEATEADLSNYHDFLIERCQELRQDEDTINGKIFMGLNPYYEGEDGFYYDVEESDGAVLLIAKGVMRDIKGVEDFICVADVIGKEAFARTRHTALGTVTDAEPETKIRTIEAPYVIDIRENALGWVPFLEMIDAPKLRQEQAMKYLAQILEKYKNEVNTEKKPDTEIENNK